MSSHITCLINVLQKYAHSESTCEYLKLACILQGIMLLHRFLKRLEQVPRRKQPVDLQRSPHVLESFPDHAQAPLASDQRVRQPQLASSGEQQGVTVPADGSQPHDAPAAEIGASTSAWHEDALHEGEGPTPLLASNGSLRPREGAHTQASPDLVHFQVDHVFEVYRVGTVVSGTVVRGDIALSQKLWWGPSDVDGTFTSVKVSGIHRSQVPVLKVSAGQYATLALDAAASKPTHSHVRAAAAGAALECAAAADAVKTAEPGSSLATAAAADLLQGSDALPPEPSSPGHDRHTAAARGSPSHAVSPLRQVHTEPPAGTLTQASNPGAAAQQPPDVHRTTSVPTMPGSQCQQDAQVNDPQRGSLQRSSSGAGAARRSASPANLPANLGTINEQPQLSHEAMQRLSQSMSDMNMSISPDSWNFGGMLVAGAA